MKRIITNILFGLMFLVGFGILIYPTVSNQWNTYRQSKLITSYEEVVREMKEEDFSEEWALARDFNEGIEYNALYSDAFPSSVQVFASCSLLPQLPDLKPYIFESHENPPVWPRIS